MRRLILDLPPSGNHRTVMARGRIMRTSKYTAWLKSMGLAIQAQIDRGQPIDAPMLTVIKLNYADHRKRDYDNVVKCINDVLTISGAIMDDSLIKAAYTYVGEVDKKYPRAEVSIFRLGDDDITQAYQMINEATQWLNNEAKEAING